MCHKTSDNSLRKINQKQKQKIIKFYYLALSKTYEHVLNLEPINVNKMPYVKHNQENIQLYEYIVQPQLQSYQTLNNKKKII
jgi:hypothetical protein